jgi:hypothetical protein
LELAILSSRRNAHPVGIGQLNPVLRASFAKPIWAMSRSPEVVPAGTLSATEVADPVDVVLLWKIGVAPVAGCATHTLAALNPVGAARVSAANTFDG